MKSALHSLQAAAVERDGELEAILIGLIAQEHVLLVGPPGTAKSYVCRSVSEAFTGLRYFECLLHGASEPDHVFGPIDPVQYRATGRYVRRSDNYAPQAELVFFDEFFRGSDMIRDSLLQFMGPERQVTVDGEQVQCPLMSAIGAANTWADSASQQAILDRWLIRLEVKPVSPQGRERLAFDALPAVHSVATLADLKAAQQASQQTLVSDEGKAAFLAILSELDAEGVRPSDRRIRASVKVAKAAAVLDGCHDVQPKHLEVLSNVLWDVPGESATKAGTIVRKISNPVGEKINQILTAVDQISREAVDAASRMVAVKKLEESEREADRLRATGNGRAEKAYQYVKRERVRVQAAMLGIDPDKAAALLG